MNLFLLYITSATGIHKWARGNWKKRGAIHESWNRCSIRLWITIRCLNAYSVRRVFLFFLNSKKKRIFWLLWHHNMNPVLWKCPIKKMVIAVCISEAEHEHAALINSVTLLHPFAMVHNHFSCRLHALRLNFGFFVSWVCCVCMCSCTRRKKVMANYLYMNLILEMIY